MSEQNGAKAGALQRPTNDDKEAWKAYWRQQGHPWRTEPEIDAERQRYLAERRSITPNIEQGIYTFKDVEPRLSRADVEWLLATLENGRGPVDESGKQQWKREGLDLRGADLRKAKLHDLPLACLRAGLTIEEWRQATIEQRDKAEVHLEEADLSHANIVEANLLGAHLEKANLFEAHLENAILRRTHLEGTNLLGAHLERANLRDAFFDTATNFGWVTLGNKDSGFVSLADVRWNGVDLSMVDWTVVNMLGDEREARELKTREGKVKDKGDQLFKYHAAVRANRQLAIALQGQGLNEDASRFAYRAQKLQRVVFRRQRKFVQYLFSLFLDTLAGYGYKPWRSFLAYLIVIIAFATAYFIIGRTLGPTLSPVSAWVFSMTSFHGRGFFPGGIELDDPLTILAALEAFVGLLIEVTFIATLTQRFFGK